MSVACPSLRLQNPFDDAPKSLAEVYKLRSALPPSPPITRIHARARACPHAQETHPRARPPIRVARGEALRVCSKKSRKRNHKRALAEADGEADDDGAADDSRAGAAREGK